MMVLACVFSAHSKPIVIDLQSMKEVAKELSTAPTITIQENGDNLRLSFSMRYISMETNEEGLTEFYIPGFTGNSISGENLYPIKNFNIPIEDGKIFEISENISSSVNMPAKLSIVPEPMIDSETNDHLLATESRNSKTTESHGIWIPQSLAIAMPSQFYRGYGFIPIQLSPIQYNEDEQIVRINYEFTIDIFQTTFSEGSLKSKANDIVKLNISEDDDFFDNYIVATPSFKNKINKQRVVSDGDISPSPIKFGYLILTTRHHLNAASKLAKWKTLLGYDVKTVSKTKAWTQSEIESSIQSYKNENQYFYYLLLIGDETQLPPITLYHPDPLSKNYVSDFPYACMDGETDLTPDIYYGRIPTSDGNESADLVEKIITYEKTPPTNQKFYKSAFHAAEFEETDNNTNITLLPGEEARMFVYTSEEASIAMNKNCNFEISRIYRAHDFVYPKLWSSIYVGDDKKIPDYLLKPGFVWNGSKDNIVSRINSGIVYGLYRGHGKTSGWGTRINMQTTDLSKLSNTDQYPIIFSITCLTGAYNKDTQCFAKQILTQKKSGASGVIASTEVSYSGKNDLLTGLLLRSIWPKSNLEIYPRSLREYSDKFDTAIDISENSLRSPKSQLGKALNYATNSFILFYSLYDTNALLTRRIFHCFGDPSMEIHNEIPKTIRGVIIKKESDGFSISGNSSEYKYGAVITVVDTTFNNIIAHQELKQCKIQALYPDKCKICISGRNLIPLIVNGSEGYDPRINPILNRQDGDDPNRAIYLDVKNEIYYDKPYDYNEFHNRKSFYEDENGDIVYEIEEAVINPDKWNRQYWELPNSRVINEIVVPAIPYVTLQIDKKEIADLNNIYIADSEFKDFNNIFCMWTGEAPDPTVDVAFNPNRPPVFKGFWPEKPIVEISEDDEIHLKLQFTPIQYSDETRTFRVHHKIIFKRGLDQSGIDLYMPDSNEIEYFGLDGIPVKEPQKGCIYVKKQGNKFTKVIIK